MSKKLKIIIMVFLVLIFTLAVKRNFVISNSHELLLGDILYGDVDGNGKIESSDYILVRKHILEIKTLGDSQIQRADTNSDGKINASDYIAIRKVIINGSSNSQPAQSTTTTQVSEKGKYEVKYYGASIIETGLSSITLKGSEAIPVFSSSNVSLSANATYVVSFDYKTTGGSNQFDIDLYPDDLPQTYLTATTTNQHYDWEVSSGSGNMGNCQLRFFDDVQESGEQDIIITNIMLGTVRKDTKEEGSTLGSLPTPARSGYRFLGWYTSGGASVSSSTKVTSNMTLYPRWEMDETYTVGPGEGYYSKTVTYMGRTFKDYKQNRMPGGIPSGGCGPVSLLNILSGYGDVDINDIIKVTGLSTSFNYINLAATQFGLQHSNIYVYKSNNPNEYTVKSYTEIALNALKNGHQLIVLVSRSSMCPNGNCNGLPYDAFSWGNHFIAIVGVKKDGETAIILNPSEGRMEEGRMEDIIRYFLPGGPQSGFVEYWK